MWASLKIVSFDCAVLYNFESYALSCEHTGVWMFFLYVTWASKQPPSKQIDMLLFFIQP